MLSSSHSTMINKLCNNQATVSIIFPDPNKAYIMGINVQTTNTRYGHKYPDPQQGIGTHISSQYWPRFSTFSHISKAKGVI